MHIGQSIVAAAEAERQSFMIESHQMQHRGVQVVNVNFVIDRVPAKFVCRSMNHAATHTAAAISENAPTRN